MAGVRSVAVTDDAHLGTTAASGHAFGSIPVTCMNFKLSFA
jgi:hypothetical protein